MGQVNWVLIVGLLVALVVVFLLNQQKKKPK